MDLTLQNLSYRSDFEKTLSQIQEILCHHKIPYSHLFTLKQDSVLNTNSELKLELEKLELFKDYLQTSIHISQEEGLWRLFNKLGITPHEDFLKLDNKSFVQYFDIHGKVYFQTFDCFKFISYTYQELISYDWSMLYERDPEIDLYLFNVANELYKTKKPVKVDIGYHKVTERMSKNNLSMLVNIKQCYPVFYRGSNQYAGFMCQYDIKPYTN